MKEGENISDFKICINTQTPLVKFSFTQEDLTKKYGELQNPLDLSSIVEGVDYQLSPGGVTRMVFPLVKQLMIKEIIEDACWVSLNPFGPDKFTVNFNNTGHSKKITFHHVSLEKEKMKLQRK